jgi:hypothetical protein
VTELIDPFRPAIPPEFHGESVRERIEIERLKAHLKGQD